MAKPSVRKVNGEWTVTRPGYGFSPGSSTTYPSAVRAWESLSSRLGSNSVSVEKSPSPRAHVFRCQRDRPAR